MECQGKEGGMVPACKVRMVCIRGHGMLGRMCVFGAMGDELALGGWVLEERGRGKWIERYGADVSDSRDTR
jgi:hypothetical protein